MRDWADIHGTAFPYGLIFVASYTGTTNDIAYVGTTTIGAPAPEPNPYSIEAIVDGQGYLRFYAALDEQSNMLIETFDPRGIYPGQFFVDKDTGLVDIDITIYVNIDGGGMVIDIQPPVDGNPDPDPDPEDPSSDVSTIPIVNPARLKVALMFVWWKLRLPATAVVVVTAAETVAIGHGMTPAEDFCDTPPSEPDSSDTPDSR